MQRITISKFKGIAPALKSSLPVGMAVEAVNTDLSDGKLALLPASRMSVPPNLYTGLSLTWPINDLTLEITIAGGVLQKTVGGVTAPLGHDPPDRAPTSVSLTTRVNLRTKSTYKWTKSGSGTAEYYCELKAGGNPNLVEPEAVRIDDSTTELQEGTLGELARREYAFGDNDSLGYSTIYIRLDDDSDPDDADDLAIYHELNPGEVAGAVRYFVTTTRDVGGHVDESGPGPVSAELVTISDKVRITRPSISDLLVTDWNLYRLSSNTGEYLLVATLPVAALTYEDNTADADLGIASPTWYTSDQGNEIVWTPPVSGIEGISTEPHCGLLFAWKGAVLYWCEPGSPDAWPSYYYMYFPHAIRRVIPLAGAVSVLTGGGPFCVQGTHPELLQPSNALGKELCAGLAAYPTAKGVAYLSDSGITIFNLVATSVLTDGVFGEEWFSANVDPAGAEIIENDGILYLTQADSDPLVLDPRSGSYIAYTLDLDESASWKWRSGDLLGKASLIQPCAVEVLGEGSIAVEVYLDGELVGSKTLTPKGMIRNRRLGLDVQQKGRAVQVALSGGAADKVTEVIVEYAQ